MATYDEWNKAITKYFTYGLQNGATVYLSIDEETLMDIGNRFERSEDDYIDWVEDFTEAVRSKCVIGNEVYLPRISGYQTDQTPRCVAFLAAMILAAHRMIEEDTADASIAQINYFTRLRQVLGLSDEETGRPEGLRQAGVEENLWQIWNRWLIGNGLLPSAARGQSNYNRYINYPLSQTLLREADKATLERLFRQRVSSNQLGRVSDEDAIGAWVRKQHFGSRHLRELVQERDFRRYEAVTDAIYDLYISIDWDQEMKTEPGDRLVGQRRMTAHLYREEDFITDNIEYYLYPRQPKGFSSEILKVIQNEKVHPLREDRKGWFMTLYVPLRSSDFAGGMSYEVKGHPQIKELVLPERKFWILVRDPENESSGVFAGWGHPGLGETFLLLCRKEYEEQMEVFRQEDLINWDHDFPIDDEWVEYRECMIVSPSWEGIIPQHQDLYDTLKPSVSATISLKGGLRMPSQSGWMEGYEPEMTIMAFDDKVEVKLIDVSSPEKSVWHQFVDTNKPISLPVLSSGAYLLEAYDSRKLAAQRVFRILPWDSLDCPQSKQPFDVNMRTFTLRGAEIKISATGGNEEE